MCFSSGAAGEEWIRTPFSSSVPNWKADGFLFYPDFHDQSEASERQAGSDAADPLWAGDCSQDSGGCGWKVSLGWGCFLQGVGCAKLLNTRSLDALTSLLVGKGGLRGEVNLTFIYLTVCLGSFALLLSSLANSQFLWENQGRVVQTKMKMGLKSCWFLWTVTLAHGSKESAVKVRAIISWEGCPP